MEANVQIDQLKYAYTKAHERILRESDALQINLTETFWKVLKDKIDHRELLNIAVRGEVRCQPKGSKVLMADGEWKNIEDMQLGEIILSVTKEGRIKREKVIDVVSGKQPTYNIIDRNGAILYSCGGEHTVPYIQKGEIREKPCKDIKGKAKDKFIMSSPTITSYRNNKDQLDIDPYTLGFWIGDGSYSGYNLDITTSNKEAIKKINGHYEIYREYSKKGTNARTYRFKPHGRLWNHLEETNLLTSGARNKHIPKKALKTNSGFRWGLLSGLIDSDGYIDKKGSISYCSASPRLINDIKELVMSLGGRCSIKECWKKCQNWETAKCYKVISINFNNEKIGLNNKLKKQRLEKRRKTKRRDVRRTAFTTQLRSDCEEVFGISISGESKYYITDNYFITKNTGKSTVVIKIAWEINKYIHKIGLNNNVHQDMWKHIFSDQTEFLRFINGNERNCCIVIDEFNSMAKTGLNATTEEALFDYYSDVFAGQYIHRVTASPDIITDKNANIILDVIGKDEKQEIVRCKLIYRDVVTKQRLTIGFVDVFVGDLIKNWQGAIRDIIEQRGVKTLDEQKRVDLWREKDFYVRYQVKKYNRMKLIKDEGVRDIRELEFADIILGTLAELEDYAKVERVDAELVNITADEVRRKHKRIYSILALNEIGQKSKAILGLYYKINKLNKKMSAKNTLPQEALVIQKTIEQAKMLVKNRVDEQKHLSALYRKYMRIE